MSFPNGILDVHDTYKWSWREIILIVCNTEANDAFNDEALNYFALAEQ